MLLKLKTKICLLYTLCPNPIKRKTSSLSLALATYLLTLPPSVLIASNISITAWLAPPWRGPHNAAIPADTEAYKLAWEEPTILTVEVEQFCSWSACNISNLSRALVITGLTLYFVVGKANIICIKFAV